MHFDRSWQIFTDVALRPSFTREDVKLVQERIVVSLSDDTDTPDVYLQKLQDKIAYAGHPYLNSTNGTPETIAKLTPEDLRAYQDRKSTRLNSSHSQISYAVFCLKKKKNP